MGSPPLLFLSALSSPGISISPSHSHFLMAYNNYGRTSKGRSYPSKTKPFVSGTRPRTRAYNSPPGRPFSQARQRGARRPLVAKQSSYNGRQAFSGRGRGSYSGGRSSRVGATQYKPAEAHCVEVTIPNGVSFSVTCIRAFANVVVGLHQDQGRASQVFCHPFDGLSCSSVTRRGLQWRRRLQEFYRR